MCVCGMGRPAVLCRAPGAGARRARLPRRAGWRPRAAWPPRARDEVRGCATARACRGGDLPPEGPRAGPRWGALRPSRRTSRASRACVRTYVRTLRARCGAHLPRALQPAGAGDEGLAARRGDGVACRHVEKAVARGAGEGGRLLPPRPSRAPLGVGARVVHPEHTPAPGAALCARCTAWSPGVRPIRKHGLGRIERRCPRVCRADVSHRAGAGARQGAASRALAAVCGPSEQAIGVWLGGPLRLQRREGWRRIRSPW